MKNKGSIFGGVLTVLAIVVAGLAFAIPLTDNNNLGGSGTIRSLNTGGGFSIGSAVSGGTPNEILYTDSSGNAASDGDFLRTVNSTTSNFFANATGTSGDYSELSIGSGYQGLIPGIDINGSAFVYSPTATSTLKYFNILGSIPALSFTGGFYGLFDYAGDTTAYLQTLTNGVVQILGTDTSGLSASYTVQPTSGRHHFSTWNNTTTNAYSFSNDDMTLLEITGQGRSLFNASTSITGANKLFSFQRGGTPFFDIDASSFSRFVGSTSGAGNTILRIVDSGFSNRFEVRDNGAVKINNAYTFATTDGSSGQAQVTNGSGTLSWATISAAGSNGAVQISDGIGSFLDSGLSYTTSSQSLIGSQFQIPNVDGSTGAENLFLLGASSGIPAVDTANRNVCVGLSCMLSLNTGTQNTGVGSDGASSDGPLHDVTTGSGNAAFAAGAGYGIQDGSFNTFLGYFSGSTDASASASIALGAEAIVTASNQLVIGSNTGSRYINHAYYGSGVSTANPQDFTWQLSPSSGDDKFGASVYHIAGLNTGAGTPGSHYFQISSGAGAGTSTPAVPRTALQIDGVSGLLISPIEYTPSSASDTCTAGMTAFDDDYLYRCIATNTWKRAAISTW